MPSRDRLKHAQALVVWASRMLNEATGLVGQELPTDHPAARFAIEVGKATRVLEASLRDRAYKAYCDRIDTLSAETKGAA